MPYIALKRCEVGESDIVIGQETVGIKKVGTRRVGIDGGGNPIEEDVFEPILRDQHAPLYREVGEHVPEADHWPNPEVWVRGGYIQYVPESDVPRASGNARVLAGQKPEPKPAEKSKRSGTVKAGS